MLEHFPAPLVYFGIFLIVAAAFVLLCVLLLSAFQSNLEGSLGGNAKFTSVLIVTSHPDDEAMFFIPTIDYLREKEVDVCILCLSSGDADGIGHIRRKELQASADVLGIRRCNVRVADSALLEDGFHQEWNKEDVTVEVTRSILEWAPDVVITFDEYGVSGHPNHQATHRGVVHAMRSKSHHGIQLLLLVSLPLHIKFGGPPLALVTLLFWMASGSGSPGSIAIQTNIGLCWRAMGAHWSQFVWFRRLFVLASTYSFINVLAEPMHGTTIPDRQPSGGARDSLSDDTRIANGTESDVN